jgi:hypothetical protein
VLNVSVGNRVNSRKACQRRPECRQLQAVAQCAMNICCVTLTQYYWAAALLRRSDTEIVVFAQVPLATRISSSTCTHATYNSRQRGVRLGETGKAVRVRPKPPLHGLHVTASKRPQRYKPAVYSKPASRIGQFWGDLPPSCFNIAVMICKAGSCLSASMRVAPSSRSALRRASSCAHTALNHGAPRLFHYTTVALN